MQIGQAERAHTFLQGNYGDELLTENVTHAYMGGIIEEVQAGEMQGLDQQTGAARTFTWGNAIRVTGKGFKSKLSGTAVKALVELYKKDSSFRDWCDKCQ